MAYSAVDVSMVADYFSTEGLTKKTGVDPKSWDFVIIKELIDNALDAVEPLPEKAIWIEYDDKGKALSIYDNGDGIPGEAIEESIYNFAVYHSSKRHLVTPSRGKQGNGLKTVICICRLRGYGLTWHTAEGEVLAFDIDATQSEAGVIGVTKQVLESSNRHGITIAGIELRQNWLSTIVREFARCNPDVNMIFNWGGRIEKHEARQEPVNRSANTNIAFYDLPHFRGLLMQQRASRKYKAFLRDTFGDAVSKAAKDGRISDIDLSVEALGGKLERLQAAQKNTKYKALRLHMIGLQNALELTDEITGLPCIVEYELTRYPTDVKRTWLNCDCYVNNTITYWDGYSVTFDERERKIGSQKGGTSRTLRELLEYCTDYRWTFHFISPQLAYTDTGKTEFDISGIIDELAAALEKAITKAKRQHREAAGRQPSKRELMRAHLQDAYNLASSGGKYAITARQIYYKLRELSGIEDSDTTYRDFTQTVLTEWLEANPEQEEKVYFSERGNFYIGSEQAGLGTGAVKRAITADGGAVNAFETFGGIESKIHLQPDFDIRYRYDKAIYIEKTGFDGIFRAERIGERYHAIIVSGQGFATRAGKTLLHYLQSQGLRLYCLHDLDYSGVNIINSIREANEKFRHPITIEDIGVTLEDVERYGIEPEQVKLTDRDYTKIDQSRYDEEQRAFFFTGTGNSYVRRVELNAFTTEQILQIIDDKLGTVNALPTVRLAEVVNLDPHKIKEAALLSVLRDRYRDLVDALPDPDIAKYGNQSMTVYEIEEQAGAIMAGILAEAEQAARAKLGKLGS